jgi:SpoVK/Ycf46/Vps4 family AAA+-type ATPase
LNAEMIHRACYMQTEHQLTEKAKKLSPRYRWDDLILPRDQVAQLRSACNHVKYKHIVYGEWGYDRKLSYGKGISMLFAGPPGTGKTMSAEIIANDLQLEIYKIDLSQVVSKYIGETEKNLNHLFNEAQKSNAILFFDEMDALFGKRSDVKDAHDKYANLETAFLLQKMEEYKGISVLASNHLHNIDEAFLRRINYIIRFPFPDAEHRELIWRGSFPKECPLAEDVDFAFLAKKFEIAGGNIKNVVMTAAFLAVEVERVVGMKHLVQALKYELQKNGKTVLKEDLGPYSALLA